MSVSNKKFIFLLIPSCLISFSSAYASESGLSTISFDYTNESFSGEFIQWVADYGARKNYIPSNEVTIQELVESECGGSSRHNIQLFQIALRDLEIASGVEIRLPPCLPEPEYTIQPRIVGENDNFWQYATTASTDLIRHGFNARPVRTFSAENSSLQTSGPIGINNIDWEIVASADIDSDSLQRANYRGDQAYSNVYSRLNSEPGSHNSIIEEFWRDRSSTMEYGLADVGNLAYDTLYLKTALDNHGLALGATDIIEIGFEDGSIHPSSDVQRIVGLADTAESRWQNYDVGGSVELAAKVAMAAQPQYGDFWDNLAWFEPSTEIVESRNPEELHQGDIVVTSSVARQEFQIPVIRRLLQDDSSSALLTEEARVPSPYEQEPEERPKIQELMTFSIDEMKNYQCKQSSHFNWGNPAFDRQFQEVVLNTRMEAERLGKNNVAARIVIADSGFVMAYESGPFKEKYFSNVGRFLFDQSPSKDYSESHRTHGTAVAGLAIGGADLWPLAHSLGVDLTITPYSIFDPIPTEDGVVEPFYNKTALKEAIEFPADIYNFSFGSRDEEYMQNLRTLFLNLGNNKLFVVAAGNNNLNDSDSGVDLGITSIYPQDWGGNETGLNMILVASLDGENLADFSNFSSKRVSLAAPGCGVASWKPVETDEEYTESLVSGTSFSTPIVSFISAIVKALSPTAKDKPAWIRARLIASADITEIPGIEHGRVLNPIKAVSLYEDVVELVDAESPLLFGRLQWTGLNDFCADLNLNEKSSLLKLARNPDSDDLEFYVYFLNENKLSTSEFECRPSKGSFITLSNENGDFDTYALDQVKDIVFRYRL